MKAVAGDPPEMTFAVDVLIGADGIHSAVRARVFGPEEDYLRPLGMRAAAFIVTKPHLNARFRSRFVPTDSIGRVAGLGPAVDRLLELCPEYPYDDVVAQIVMPDGQGAGPFRQLGGPPDRGQDRKISPGLTPVAQETGKGTVALSPIMF